MSPKSEIEPIEADEDYRAALAEVESLMNASPDSPEGERLDILATLISTYEQQHFPLEPPLRP